MASSKLAKNIFALGKHHNYLVAGNVCNAFVLGELGSKEDFFLVGAEPPDKSGNPLLTGNVLNSDGTLLFRLVRNVLASNPGHCAKTVDDQGGYEIYDDRGVPILKVTTRFEKLSRIPRECFVTTISANFFDRSGSLVFKAHSGDENEHIEATAKAAFGFEKVFDFVQGFENHELDIAKAMLASGGAIQ